MPNLILWTLTVNWSFSCSISFKTVNKLVRYNSHFCLARSSFRVSFCIFLSCSSYKEINRWVKNPRAVSHGRWKRMNYTSGLYRHPIFPCSLEKKEQALELGEHLSQIIVSADNIVRVEVPREKRKNNLQIENKLINNIKFEVNNTPNDPTDTPSRLEIFNLK